MHRRRFLTLAAAAGLLAAGSPARADDVTDTLAQITRARASMKSLVASFTQERTIGLLATVVKSDGALALVTPDRLRWELLPPDAITYWITPEGFAFATKAGGANVGKGAAGRFGAVLGDMLVLLGGDLEKLRARYDLAIPSRENGVTLVALPRDAEVKKHVTRIEMTAGPELWRVKTVVLEESGGDRSVITFRDVVRDAPVDAAKMRPPAR